jgi:hypothetical protein
LKEIVEDLDDVVTSLETFRVDQVAAAKKEQEQKEADQKELKGEWRKLWFGAIGLVITSMITIAINGILYLLHLPR